jgi:hypothetical protein
VLYYIRVLHRAQWVSQKFCQVECSEFNVLMYEFLIGFVRKQSLRERIERGGAATGSAT